MCAMRSTRAPAMQAHILKLAAWLVLGFSTYRMCPLSRRPTYWKCNNRDGTVRRRNMAGAGAGARGGRAAARGAAESSTCGGEVRVGGLAGRGESVAGAYERGEDLVALDFTTAGFIAANAGCDCLVSLTR